jgi:hypothetical protein
MRYEGHPETTPAEVNAACTDHHREPTPRRIYSSKETPPAQVETLATHAERVWVVEQMRGETLEHVSVAAAAPEAVPVIGAHGCRLGVHERTARHGERDHAARDVAVPRRPHDLR